MSLSVNTIVTGTITGMNTSGWVLTADEYPKYTIVLPTTTVKTAQKIGDTVEVTIKTVVGRSATAEANS